MTSETNQIELTQFDTDNIENIHKRWSRWAKRLDRLLDIKGIKEDSTRINYLFFYGGDNLEDVYTELAEDTDSFEDIIRKLCNLFSTYETPSESDNNNNNNNNSNDQLDEQKAKNEEEQEEVTFELVLDEENETVNDLIQRYNKHLCKMKDLEKEKQELDDLIKKTIGLKIRQVTSSNNNNNNNHTDSNNGLEDKKIKEECIDLLCKNLCSKKRADKNLDCIRDKKIVSFDNSIYLPPPPLHLLNYKKPCLTSLRQNNYKAGCNAIRRLKF
jgi:hypothetical protein